MQRHSKSAGQTQKDYKSGELGRPSLQQNGSNDDILHSTPSKAARDDHRSRRLASTSPPPPPPSLPPSALASSSSGGRSHGQQHHVHFALTPTKSSSPSPRHSSSRLVGDVHPVSDTSLIAASSADRRRPFEPSREDFSGVRVTADCPAAAAPLQRPLDLPLQDHETSVRSRRRYQSESGAGNSRRRGDLGESESIAGMLNNFSKALGK